MLRPVAVGTIAGLLFGAAASGIALAKWEPMALIFVHPDRPAVGELVLVRVHVSNPDWSLYEDSDVRLKVRPAEVQRGSDIHFLPMKRRDAGVFERSFRPDRPGELILSVYVGDHQASGAPYRLEVSEALPSRGQPATLATTAAAPLAVVILGLSLLALLRRSIGRR